MEDNGTGPGKNFLDAAEENPCTGCSAPCCRFLLIPHHTPSTLMELDYIRYMMGFPGIEMILTREGHWRVVVEQACGFLDTETCHCTVHNTPRKPKTCVFFNPYDCWYKRNFHATDDPPDLVRISPLGLEAVLAHVRFDANSRIIETPPWELVRDLIRGLREKSPAVPAAQFTQISLAPPGQPLTN